jgi:predicted dehydrogenase
MEKGSAPGVGPRAAKAAAAGLRAGILGAGFIGRVHARSARLAGATIAAVVTSTPERSAEAGRVLGAARHFDSAEELIASDEVDVVHVCTPNNLHVPQALAAIEAGKHVVCEKPIALDVAGARELLAAVEGTDLVATVPFVYRYYPTVREARVRLRSPSAGEVRLIHGGYLQDWLLAAGEDSWRVDRRLGGASWAFADIGSHWCDLIEFASGDRIAAVTARTTEDIATVLFETERGAAGSVVISQVSAGHKNRLWFEVSTGSETLAFDQEQPETLAVRRRSAAEHIRRDFDTLSPEAAAYVTLPGGHPQGYHDCFDAFIAETYAAITAGEKADGLPGLADGVRAARITEAVLESARAGSWVEVDEG